MDATLLIVYFSFFTFVFAVVDFVVAEFLMGRAYINNLVNLGLLERYKAAFESLGLDIGRMRHGGRSTTSLFPASAAAASRRRPTRPAHRSRRSCCGMRINL